MHLSHDIWRAGHLSFCYECGGYSAGKASSILKNVCLGDKQTTIRSRLRGGLHPVSKVPLGYMHRVVPGSSIAPPAGEV